MDHEVIYVDLRARVRGRRDCQHPRARHIHGTWLAYVKDGCSCFPCRAAWAKYQKHHQYRRRLGLRTIDGSGTRRRLQALHRIGYSAQVLAEALGRKNRGSVLQWMQGPILRESAEEVRRLYDQLSTTLPPPSAGVTQTKQWAIERGWPPPAAFDDEDIDDPSPLIDKLARHYTRKESG